MCSRLLAADYLEGKSRCFAPVFKMEIGVLMKCYRAGALLPSCALSSLRLYADSSVWMTRLFWAPLRVPIAPDEPGTFSGRQ